MDWIRLLKAVGITLMFFVAALIISVLLVYLFKYIGASAILFIVQFVVLAYMIYSYME